MHVQQHLHTSVLAPASLAVANNSCDNGCDEDEAEDRNDDVEPERDVARQSSWTTSLGVKGGAATEALVTMYGDLPSGPVIMAVVVRVTGDVCVTGVTGDHDE